MSIAENAQVIELEVTNDPIRGSITLTKYDADYPDNRLTGAVFEVYRDVNGDKVLDDGDELLAEMDDEGEGVYWMRELEAGGYLVRETEAPEGYVLDETAYYVEITTDGEVCVVENEAGVGFLNQPLRGALKIVKTTDDGKVEGFAFRVSGANGYDMTFTTDANGEILIEGLRIGEYLKLNPLTSCESERIVLNHKPLFATARAHVQQTACPCIEHTSLGVVVNNHVIWA